MPYPKCKVYNDGSHYIAIPHTTRPRLTKRPHTDELIEVTNTTLNSENCSVKTDLAPQNNENTINARECSTSVEIPSTTRKMTRRQLFDELYAECKDLNKKERKVYILAKIKQYFPNEESARQFVNAQFDRLQRNAIVKRTRLVRKVNLQTFNYFCTFTYDSAKHTEESFRKKLADTFKKMCYRRKWKYIGVWERSPEKKRLHFHGLFYIPDGTMIGELKEVKDYSPIQGRVQTTYQNTYFNERFGRSDFKEVDSHVLGEAIAYLTKYLEKSGERLVYSRGLPQYFISDIMDDDVACTIGQEDRKLLLFDSFECIDEGTLMGKVSKKVIEQMPKVN